MRGGPPAPPPPHMQQSKCIFGHILCGPCPETRRWQGWFTSKPCGVSNLPITLAVQLQPLNSALLRNQSPAPSVPCVAACQPSPTPPCSTKRGEARRERQELNLHYIRCTGAIKPLRQAQTAPFSHTKARQKPCKARSPLPGYTSQPGAGRER